MRSRVLKEFESAGRGGQIRLDWIRLDENILPQALRPLPKPGPLLLSTIKWKLYILVGLWI